MGLAFAVESWIWYAVGVFLVTCRLVSRTHLLKGIQHLQLDDWLMVIVVCSYTCFISIINKETHFNSNLIAPGLDVNTFSETERELRIYGSKLTVVVEQLQCVTVWLIKGCLLILYYRVTIRLKVNWLVKCLACYMIATFIIMEVLYFGVWCRPFHNYWALPTPNLQCSTAKNHLITNAIFNISSDLVMLIIAFSLFIGNRLPWHRKLILSLVFGLGVFTILSSVFNKYYSFTHPFSDQWTYWYVRESSTALIVANIPFTWTILRRIFKLKSFDGNSDTGVYTVPYHGSRSARERKVSKATTAYSPRSPRPKSATHSYSSSYLQSPRNSRHQSVSIPEHQAKKWKDAGVYGREDQDALAYDPWDYGNEDIAEEVAVPEMATLRSMISDGSEIYSSPSSPRSNRSRKLRDEEAQLSMQERTSVIYQDFLMDNEFNEKNELDEKL